MLTNVINCGDSRAMDTIAGGSVHLIVTSPPYNVGKPYDAHGDTLELREYLVMLEAVWAECNRVLAPGGRIAINVANTYRQPYLPLHSHIIRQMQAQGFLMRGEIIWDKGATAGVSTAWGSFARASNPVLRDVHEYVLVFCKESMKLEGRRGPDGLLPPTGITNQQFVDWTRSIWRMETQSRLSDKAGKRYNHPAPFPVELPRRLMLLYTNRGDVVLDPFMGSGSTAVAAVEEGRQFVGYDISPEYCAWARERVESAETRPFVQPAAAAKPKRVYPRRRKAVGEPVLQPMLATGPPEQAATPKEVGQATA
ncbi:MAG: site-specific DNA-methyltransferase [Dehalococcoidia bacterium]|nr:site-specific DNA-methyltransferase [Dehalococcoidia bacterium]